MLTLEVCFPTGRYCAARQDAAHLPEWPPHPSRVFSALVAAAYRLRAPLADEDRAVLRALESAGAPSIWAPSADARPAADVFVPVNDARTRLTSHPAAPNRQARHFPKVYLLGEPTVHFAWSLELSSEMSAALRQMAAAVTHVGAADSLAIARVLDQPPPTLPNFVPDAAGSLFLRVPAEGRLAELDSIESLRRQSGLRRPIAAVCEPSVAYRPNGAAGDVPALDTAYDLAVFRLDGASWDAAGAHVLADAVRRAVMARIGEAVPAAVHGHQPGVRHVAWLPLPDVGHSHATQRVLGVMVAVPRDLADHERATTARATMGAWPLTLPGGVMATLSQLVAGDLRPAGLRVETWTGPAKEWATVTPVLLDRPPRKITAEATLRSLAQSLAHAGLPLPTDVRVLPSSAFAGGPGAREIADPRPKVHAAVRFARPVTGPVIAGRLRNYGIGLFRPLPAGVFDGL